MKNLKQEEKETSIVCDKCGKHMVLRWGKNGEYLVCSGRPACKNKKNVTVDKDGNISIVEEATLRRLPPVRRHPGGKERPFRPFHRVQQLSRMQVYKAVHHGPPLPRGGLHGRAGRADLQEKERNSTDAPVIPTAPSPRAFSRRRASAPSCGAPVLFSFRGKLSCLRKDCGWKSA